MVWLCSSEPGWMEARIYFGGMVSGASVDWNRCNCKRNLLTCNFYDVDYLVRKKCENFL
ncbi:hypothetical protein HU200_006927 [Digitaria exilis]|uniref:Uncharacterized protein n=1 Tax=Digitaria exilis TaxID=1010633 RepID=A0A835E2Z0_9POAL|nr:hypothetical protein HU200_055477 [Digitaria exilis]KAF8769098.1 hypothetical protein HU200_006927 [Digitaria exilis]